MKLEAFIGMNRLKRYRMGKLFFMAGKLLKFINKDVSFEDEASQFYIMMRLYYIITAVYILFFNAFAVGFGFWRQMPVLFAWLPLHVLSFFGTYRYRRRVVFHMFSAGILIWIVLAVHFMGWKYGAQYFMYPLMVISFFATSKNYVGKAIYSVVLFVLYVFLYTYGMGHGAVVQLPDRIDDMMLFMSTFILFLCMFVICFMFSNSNQSALQKLAGYNKKLKQEAQTDALTGLYNRHYMYQVLDVAVNQQNYSQFTIAMGDIDLFKKVNDTLGHNCGDYVLKSVAAYFKEYMVGKGTVCRWGGEEFLFLFSHDNGDDAFIHVQEMREKIERLAIEYEGTRVPITMTFGVEEYFSGTSVTELIKKADDKLYTGKETGRNKVVY